MQDMASFNKKVDLEGNAIPEGDEDEDEDFFGPTNVTKGFKPAVRRKNRGTVYKAKTYEWDD